MTKRTRHTQGILIVPLLLVLSLTACTDRDLQAVSSALSDTAKAVGVFQETVINANAQGLLSETGTRQLLQVSLRVNAAGQQAVTITRNLSKLAPENRSQLLQILKPVIDSVAEADAQLVRVIPEPRVRANIASALTLIQTTLNTIQLTLAGR